MTRARDLSNDEANGGGATPPFVAGKNKIINGDFGIWQRGTTFNSNGVYTSDRWAAYWNGTPTLSISQQAFTPGAAPVAGYDGQFFYRLNVTTAGSGGSFLLFGQQRIEDVRTLAGQTATLSFWAKSDAARAINVGIRQNFGSGGSAETYPSITPNPIVTSTNWQRFTFQVSMSSLSGKTIGTGSYVAIDIYATAQNITQTIDIWGVQFEAGPVATPFTEASGGYPGAELALCQRYYVRWTGSASYPRFATKGVSLSSTNVYFYVDHPVEMRVAPTAIEFSTLAAYNFTPNVYALSNLILDNCNTKISSLYGTTTGMTSNQFMVLVGNNTASGYLALSSEL
jgi:hypothetical protein